MTDIYTLTHAVITINMDDFKVTASWQIPPATDDPNVSEVTVTHTITLELGKAVVTDHRVPENQPGYKPSKPDVTKEGR